MEHLERWVHSLHALTLIAMIVICTDSWIEWCLLSCYKWQWIAVPGRGSLNYSGATMLVDRPKKLTLKKSTMAYIHNIHHFTMFPIIAELHLHTQYTAYVAPQLVPKKMGRRRFLYLNESRLKKYLVLVYMLVYWLINGQYFCICISCSSKTVESASR